MESAMAKAFNLKFFKQIRSQVDNASFVLAGERGPCPDAADAGVMERFSCKMAIAPTASISIICGGTSACIEPIPANVYTHKTLSGSYTVKNPYLAQIMWRKGVVDQDAVWTSILEHGGSVQHLDFLTPQEKNVFKTSFELDQRWLLELQADRTPFIDQATSLNLFIEGDVDKWDLLMLHFRAWELGLKSLYYLRSKSVQRAGFAGGVEADNTLEKPHFVAEVRDYDVCLACE
jgi:ribonucleoside-diphosphate reductase alpha chain